MVLTLKDNSSATAVQHGNAWLWELELELLWLELELLDRLELLELD